MSALRGVLANEPPADPQLIEEYFEVGNVINIKVISGRWKCDIDQRCAAAATKHEAGRLLNQATITSERESADLECRQRSVRIALRKRESLPPSDGDFEVPEPRDSTLTRNINKAQERVELPSGCDFRTVGRAGGQRYVLGAGIVVALALGLDPANRFVCRPKFHNWRRRGCLLS